MQEHRCRFCKNIVDEKDTHCRRCGYALNFSSEKKKGTSISRKRWNLLVIFFLMVAVTGAGLFVYNLIIEGAKSTFASVGLFLMLVGFLGFMTGKLGRWFT